MCSHLSQLLTFYTSSCLLLLESTYSKHSGYWFTPMATSWISQLRGERRRTIQNKPMVDDVAWLVVEIYMRSHSLCVLSFGSLFVIIQKLNFVRNLNIKNGRILFHWIFILASAAGPYHRYSSAIHINIYTWRKYAYVCGSAGEGGKADYVRWRNSLTDSIQLWTENVYPSSH